jgi:hypothetical protein
VGIDRPEDPDEPPDRPADHRDDQGGGGRAARAGGVQVETRPRQEYYADLRVAASAEESVAAQRTAAREQAAAQKWDESSKESRWMWSEYQRKWPPEERAPAGKSADPPGSWHGEGDRYQPPAAANGRVEAECARVTEREQETISPALRATESQDPDRHLIGFEYRLKGQDRIKEKVEGTIKDFHRSPEQAVSLVADAIRYTFQYREARYTQGVLADIARLKDQGFELDKLKNSWSDEQYKGINSQWIEPDSGQRFEVQFHTRISFEGKQLTHGAYERLRTPQPHKPDKFEQMVLEAFQKKVTAEVPVPPGADGIPDYPERGTDAR